MTKDEQFNSQSDPSDDPSDGGPRPVALASLEVESNGCPKLLTEAELRRLERDNLLGTLQAAKWKNRGPDGAAEMLGVRPTTLYSRMQRWASRRRIRSGNRRRRGSAVRPSLSPKHVGCGLVGESTCHGAACRRLLVLSRECRSVKAHAPRSGGGRVSRRRPGLAAVRG
jgi:hypothetical protein